MTPMEALQLLEQIAANSSMPLAVHLQAKQAIKTIIKALPQPEQQPPGKIEVHDEPLHMPEASHD